MQDDKEIKLTNIITAIVIQTRSREQNTVACSLDHSSEGKQANRNLGVREDMFDRWGNVSILCRPTKPIIPTSPNR